MNGLIAAMGMVGLSLAAGVAQADGGMDLMKKARCNACHAVDKKLVGPAFQDVAAKYKGNAKAEATLVEKIKSGKGHPAAKASDDDLKAIVKWILSM